MTVVALVLGIAGFLVFMAGCGYAFIKIMGDQDEPDQNPITSTLFDIIIFDGLFFVLGFAKMIFKNKTSLALVAVGTLIILFAFIIG